MYLCPINIELIMIIETIIVLLIGVVLPLIYIVRKEFKHSKEQAKLNSEPTVETINFDETKITITVQQKGDKEYNVTISDTVKL